MSCLAALKWGTWSHTFKKISTKLTSIPLFYSTLMQINVSHYAG